MAKRRTRKQKIKAKTVRVKVRVEPRTTQLETEDVIKIEKVKEPEKKTQKKLIVRDLIKTGLISLFLLIILIGVYIYLK
jgi:hypothetical protein